MKVLFTAFALFISASVFSQTQITAKNYGALEFVELDYGIAAVERGIEHPLKNTPTGTHGWLSDFVITKVTDTIHISRGVSFGVVYQLNSKDTMDIKIDIEWVYPQIIKNDKKRKFSSIRYTTQRPTNTPSASSYSLDEPYEMVEGNWVLNLYIEDQLIYSKTFYLYK